MMFPSKADIKFFTSEEAKRIQELWEPKFGDRLCPKGAPTGFHQVYIHGTGLHHVAFFSERDMTVDVECIAELERHYIWLPRQGQLQEMLEKRGYGLYHLGDERFHPDFDGKDWNPEEPYRALAQGKEPGDYVKGTGPTPAIALGRALIEVTSKGGREEGE